MFHCATGGQIYFATPDALSGGLLPLLQQSRPTFFFAVPRVWEKMMDSMKAKSAENSDTKKKIAIAAKACGLSRNMSLAQTGGESSGDCGIMYTIYRKLVRQQCTRHTHPRTPSPLAHRPHATTVPHTPAHFSHTSRAQVFGKVRQTLGLDRAFLLGSGAAPISKEVLEFFWGLDLPILEGFGMSETTGASPHVDGCRCCAMDEPVRWAVAHRRPPSTPTPTPTRRAQAS